jgi:hypothetical protein
MQIVTNIELIIFLRRGAKRWENFLITTINIWE